MTIEDNIVLVGKKPLMNYVLSVNTIREKGHKEIILKARGRAISRAVDIEEMSLRRFLTDWKVSEVSFGTEEMEVTEKSVRGPDGVTWTTTKLAVPMQKKVSTIEIKLVKKTDEYDK